MPEDYKVNTMGKIELNKCLVSEINAFGDDFHGIDYYWAGGLDLS
jgi:hypothetical protein